MKCITPSNRKTKFLEAGLDPVFLKYCAIVSTGRPLIPLTGSVAIKKLLADPVS
jgi:hypothetical protein